MSRADKQFMRAIQNLTKAWDKGYSSDEQRIKEAIKLLEGAEMYIVEQKEVLKKELDSDE